MLARLADKLIMMPTRYPIDAGERVHQVVDSEVGPFEVWRQRNNAEESVSVFVLKFPGTGGRAERATDHPADCWTDVATEVWAVNPPGYGGSPGRASLRNAQAVANAAFQEISRVADGRPIVVSGTSLGTLSALFLAARESFAGVILRNPPPLRQLIGVRFGWYSLGTCKWIAKQVPDVLCPIENARGSRIPAVFISSRRDRIVPSHLQDQVYEAYAGESRVVHLMDADHGDLMTQQEATEYLQYLDWLRRQVQQTDIRSSASAAWS